MKVKHMLGVLAHNRNIIDFKIQLAVRDILFHPCQPAGEILLTLC